MPTDLGLSDNACDDRNAFFEQEVADEEHPAEPPGKPDAG